MKTKSLSERIAKAREAKEMLKLAPVYENSSPLAKTTFALAQTTIGIIEELLEENQALQAKVKELENFVNKKVTEAREEISEIRSSGDRNSYTAGYEKGTIDLGNEILTQIKE
jgi:hypothetical protein